MLAEDVRQLARLRRFAGTLPLASDVCYCCRVSSMSDVVEVCVAPGRSFYRGLRHCKDVWVCPECSSKASMRRARALRLMVHSAIAQGYRTLLVTFTFSHTLGDRLSDLREAFTRALEKMRSGRRWHDMRSRHGLEGFVRGQEVTYGEKNGWHPHCHELWFCSGDVNVSELRKDVQAAYLAALHKVGLKALPGVGVDVRESDAEITKYISKFGKAPRWDAAREVANGRRKSGKKGETPWQLLSRAADGDAVARSLFVEYAESYRGVRQLYVSRGLVKLLGLGEDVETLTDVEKLDVETEEEAKATVVLRLSGIGYWCVWSRQLEADLLLLALTHSPGELREWVASVVREVLPKSAPDVGFARSLAVAA